ncbi:hypothetical protein DSECCO2_454850 [anaerobic digester metagenome]
MTPTGSLKTSYRETWVTIGFSGSIPYFARVASISDKGRSRFFSDKGSMNGGMMKLGTFQRGRYWKLENTPA